MARVSALDAVTAVKSPLDPENAGQIGQGGRAALVDFEIRGDPDDATKKIDPVVASVDEAQEAHPELFIGSFGVSASKEVEGAFLDDLKKAGLLSIPVTLIILIVVFGALVAAGIPLLLALAADRCDLRAGRAPDLAHPNRRGDLRADSAHRARGRRRLLDVLLEARAGGTGRRAQRGGGAQRCRGDVGTLRAHLRTDRDRRHVQCSSPESRACRRSPWARSWSSRWRCSDRSPSCPPPSRGSVTESSEGASRSSAGSAATTARGGSGGLSSPPSCGDQWSRPSFRRDCCWRSPCRRCSYARCSPASRRTHSPCRRSRRTTASRRRSRGAKSRPVSS